MVMSRLSIDEPAGVASSVLYGRQLRCACNVIDRATSGASAVHQVCASPPTSGTVFSNATYAAVISASSACGHPALARVVLESTVAIGCRDICPSSKGK